MYGRIPHFATILLRRFNVFQIGADLADADELGVIPFTCKQLFPRGQTVFITDAIFENHPDKALRIVLHIMERNAEKARGFETWRLYARPGVCEWLKELADEHYEDDFLQEDITFVIPDLSPVTTR